jgi:hypothetical protein
MRPFPSGLWTYDGSQTAAGNASEEGLEGGFTDVVAVVPFARAEPDGGISSAPERRGSFVYVGDIDRHPHLHTKE